MTFIAMLDELDERMGMMMAHVQANGQTFRQLAEWYQQATEILNTLPADLRE